jgi:hypothetical protein
VSVVNDTLCNCIGYFTRDDTREEDATESPLSSGRGTKVELIHELHLDYLPHTYTHPRIHTLFVCHTSSGSHTVCVSTLLRTLQSIPR